VRNDHGERRNDKNPEKICLLSEAADVTGIPIYLEYQQILK